MESSAAIALFTHVILSVPLLIIKSLSAISKLENQPLIDPITLLKASPMMELWKRRKISNK